MADNITAEKLKAKIAGEFCILEPMSFHCRWLHKNNHASMEEIKFLIKCNMFLDILKDADLENMTSKKVRLQLEGEFDCKLISRKKEIDKMVVDYINSKEKDDEDEEEEDEPEPSPPPKKKKKKASESEEEISSDEDKPRKRRAAAPPKKAPRKKAEGSGKGIYCFLFFDVIN